MFISTVKMPGGISRAEVSVGGGGGGERGAGREGLACMEIDQCALTVRRV